MRILFPLPNRGFDPTESAVPCKALIGAGHEVVFATPDARPSAADPRILSGRGFGPFRPWLRAVPHARELYAWMEASFAFQHPVPYANLDPDDFDGVLLTGGHADDMNSYFESKPVQALVAAHMIEDKPVGAICHGVLVPARATNPQTGRSALYGRRTTALTKLQELWLGSYYRTHQRTVEAQVIDALAKPEDFERGPFTWAREGPNKPNVGFAVRDGNYVSARYFVDAYVFAAAVLGVVAGREQVSLRACS